MLSSKNILRQKDIKYTRLMACEVQQLPPSCGTHRLTSYFVHQVLLQEQDFMKRFSVAVALLAAATLSATTSSAQSSKAVSIGISGGAAIPVGGLADDYTTGYNGTASLMLKSFGSPIGLRIDGSYNHMAVKNDRTI